MNTTEHSFPLPDVESHKLDEVKGRITTEPYLGSVAAFVKANPWAAIALTGAAGFLAWIWFKPRAS